MNSFEKDLKDSVEGEIYFDTITRNVYSVDASIFEILPLCIVIPKNKKALIRTIKIAHSYHIPISARGAATGITGGCLGRGVIIDTSKYLHRILEINLKEETVTCEPGVVQDALNNALAPLGYRLGPDTSTGNRATLGGMLANNAAGARSLRFGKMVDHVVEVEMILSDGQPLHFKHLSEKEWAEKCQLLTSEGKIYNQLWHIKNEFAQDIEDHFPKIPRRVSGYNLDELIKEKGINVSKLIVGSEGTLGIVTEMKLKIVPMIQNTGLCLISFQDMIEGLCHVPEMLALAPLSLEMIDDQIIQLGRFSPSMRGKLNWLQGHPKALFIAEFDGDNLQQKLKQISELDIGESRQVLLDCKSISEVWALRKAGLGLLLSRRSYSRAIAFIEDMSIPPEKLPDFMAVFIDYLHSKGKTAGIYGHVGAGCMHIRPYMNLEEESELSLMKLMMQDIAELVLEYGGALSGEHGDGLIRSWLNPKMFGARLTQAFMDLKLAFDPANLMNPGKIVFSPPPFEELRTSPSHPLKSFSTQLNFSAEGGFELAVDLCNGNGLCRKKEETMCPSFQVTNDEFHSTRARAQALRSILHGRLPEEALTSQGMHDVMDLCISCKGCKTECPSQVDMAKMKSEFLYHYYEKHGMPWRNYLFGYIGPLSGWMSGMPSIFNMLNKSASVKKILELIGITPHRTFPKLAEETFSKWFADYKQSEQQPEVVLFNDTFTQFHDPEIGQAAVKILNLLGYRVIVPAWSCCGRPLLSKGMIKQAQGYALSVFNRLLPYAKQGLPIIGLEPSCLLTIKDDYGGLISSDELKLLSSHCVTLDEFLYDLLDKGKLHLPFNRKSCEVQVHGHCYQKSSVGMEPTMKLLRGVPGFQVSQIPSGCCGMAGSFGYEKEHYKISMAMGALKLFPAIHASNNDTVIIASGTSCRHQIADGTQRRPVHLAQALWQSLNTEKLL